MVEMWFDGSLSARKGDIIRVLRAIQHGTELRATKVENISGGGIERSHVDGTMMTVMPSDLDPPLVGRVEKLDRRDGNTHVTLATGVYEEPNLFFPAGEFKAGQEALRRILRTDVRRYLKVADTYVSSATIELLGAVQTGTDVRLLCGTINDLPAVKGKAIDLRGKGHSIQMRQGRMSEMHGRYIITEGAAWMIDHSLKDFGTKDCAAARLTTSISGLEQVFDKRWRIASYI